MKKEIEIHLDRSVPVFLKNGNASIINRTEKWSINVQCREKDGTADRELSEITINLHNGKKWQGSIQALAAIDTFAHNAQLALHKGTFHELYLEEAEECFKDVTSIMSHFSTEEALQPAEYLKVLNRELGDIRKSIEGICNNFTDAEVRQELGRCSDNIQDAGINLNSVKKLLSQPSA